MPVRPARRGGLDPGLLLLLTPVLWGATFPAAKVGFGIIGVFPFMAWTRVLGFLTILAAIPFVARHRVTRRAVRRVMGPGALLGSLVFLGYTLQSLGLDRTTATNAGFITGLYVVFTPILAYVVFRRPVGAAAWIAVIVSLAGLVLLSIPSLTDLTPRFGDLLVLASAVAWSAHVVGVGYFAGRHPSLLLSLAQIGTAAALHVVATIPVGVRPSANGTLWLMLLLTGVLGTGVAYTLQVVAQERITAVRAVVLLAGESVASAVFSYVFLGERLAAHQWAGAAVVLVAMVVSELTARRADLRIEATEPV